MAIRRFVRKGARKVRSYAEAATRAMEDHRRAVGKTFMVKEVDGYIGNDSVTCGGRIKVRVQKTATDDVTRVVDNFVDPYWDVEVVAGPKKCRHVRSAWVFGPSYEFPKKSRVFAFPRKAKAR
jgi:hypothetical protein